MGAVAAREFGLLGALARPQSGVWPSISRSWDRSSDAGAGSMTRRRPPRALPSFDFRVHLRPEEECHIRQPQPAEQDDRGGEGPVGHVEAGEVRQVIGEAKRSQQPDPDAGRSTRSYPSERTLPDVRRYEVEEREDQ